MAAQQSRYAFTVLAGTGALLAAVFAAVCVAILGPSDIIYCKNSDSLAKVGVKLNQALGGGHSGSSTFCVVPSATAWELASLALIVVFAIGIAMLRRSLSRAQSTRSWPN
ncbi:MAG TPA: hypothetical protein VLX89_07315 [Actinomycetota bacterium]|jgi:hypothetical protein|nr:hypothetical protein [Actinomycetota bacterium]